MNTKRTKNIAVIACLAVLTATVLAATVTVTGHAYNGTYTLHSDDQVKVRWPNGSGGYYESYHWAAYGTYSDSMPDNVIATAKIIDINGSQVSDVVSVATSSSHNFPNLYRRVP